MPEILPPHIVAIIDQQQSMHQGAIKQMVAQYRLLRSQLGLTCPDAMAKMAVDIAEQIDAKAEELGGVPLEQQRSNLIDMAITAAVMIAEGPGPDMPPDPGRELRL